MRVDVHVYRRRGWPAVANGVRIFCLGRLGKCLGHSWLLK